MQLFADVDKEVWLAIVSLAGVVVTGIFGVINVMMQQRNKNVTVDTTTKLKQALDVNTALTKATSEKAEETHRFIQENKS